MYVEHDIDIYIYIVYDSCDIELPAPSLIIQALCQLCPRIPKKFDQSKILCINQSELGEL